MTCVSIGIIKSLYKIMQFSSKGVNKYWASIRSTHRLVERPAKQYPPSFSKDCLKTHICYFCCFSSMFAVPSHFTKRSTPPRLKHSSMFTITLANFPSIRRSRRCILICYFFLNYWNYLGVLCEIISSCITFVEREHVSSLIKF